ncbi:MAG: chromate transporter [Eisenbergiella sp.]
MATYVGYNIAGPAGGIAATLGEILPAIIIVTLVSKSWKNSVTTNRSIIYFMVCAPLSQASSQPPALMFLK